MSQWQPIETAPKDGTFILLLGDSGYTTTPYRVAVGRWVQEYRDFWITHSNDAFTDDGAPPTHWMPWNPPYIVSNPSAEYGKEPDMERMGAQHIKECRGCDAMILWAKHIGTGRAAPLVKAKEGEKPNIVTWFDETANQWFYAIAGTADYTDTASARGIPEHVSHFSNCPRSKDFKAAPKTESEERQASIK